MTPKAKAAISSSTLGRTEKKASCCQHFQFWVSAQAAPSLPSRTTFLRCLTPHTLAPAGRATVCLSLLLEPILVCLLPNLTFWQTYNGPEYFLGSFSWVPTCPCGLEDWLLLWQDDSFLRACPERACYSLILARTHWVQNITSWYLASGVTHSLHKVFIFVHILEQYS